MRALRLVYRADGGHPIGTGHMWRAVRVLRALAERTELDARIAYADDEFARQCAALTPATPIVLPPRGDPDAVKPLLDSGGLVDELHRHPADVVVVDMLDTPDAPMAEVRATGARIVTLDDRGPGRRHADLIVNTLIEEPDRGSLAPGTRLLEGPPYVVLDPLFARMHAERRPRAVGPVARRILVSVGGADAAGLALRVGEALASVGDLDRVDFVVGAAFPFRVELDAALREAPWTCAVHVGLPDLVRCYQQCDLAIVAGGLTMYEVCCTGTPALAVCQPLDHQLELAGRLTELGAMDTVGYGMVASVQEIANAIRNLQMDGARRRAMSARGPELVDGRGTARVAKDIMAVADRGDR